MALGAVETSLEFVPARFPEAVSMKPGAYDVIVGESDSSDSSSSEDNHAMNGVSKGSAVSDAESVTESSASSEAEVNNESTRMESSSDEDSESEDESDDDRYALKSKDESSDSEESDSDLERKVKSTTENTNHVTTLPASHFYEFNENPKDQGSRSTRIHKSWQPTASAPVGLENRGVTCYMNAAMQLMFHLPAVGRYLLEVSQGKHDNIKTNSVTAELAKLFRRLTEGKKKNGVYPTRIIQRLEDINCMMSEWEQEDSHEYLMSLMGRLQEDSTPKGEKLRASILHDIFGGTIEQKVTCGTCAHVSTTNQDFYDIPVSFSRKEKRAHKYTLIQSVKDFFTPEIIRPKDKEGYQCEKCKAITKAVKENAIQEAPEYLTVHIKRFKFSGMAGQKVKDPMEYPMDLDLTAYSTTHEPLRYSLVGVIVHEGRTLSSGHYIAITRQPNMKWYEYDDEIVRKVSDAYARKQENAYILVYSRLSAKKPRRAKRTAAAALTTNSRPKKVAKKIAPPPQHSPKRRTALPRGREKGIVVATRAQEQARKSHSQVSAEIDAIFGRK